MVYNDELRRMLWHAERHDAYRLRRHVHRRHDVTNNAREGRLESLAVVYDLVPYTGNDEYEPTTLVADLTNGRELRATVESVLDTTALPGAYVACWSATAVDRYTWAGVSIFTPEHRTQTIIEHDGYRLPAPRPMRGPVSETLQHALYESWLHSTTLDNYRTGCRLSYSACEVTV